MKIIGEFVGKYMALIILAVSVLATSLAGTAFPDLSLATVPGAIFSVWHNISGAMLAGILRRIEEDGSNEDSCAKNK